MEFRETLLAAQRNQQQKSSDNAYYKARFDPPKKEQKSKDKLSANIQKFLAKKEEEEQKKKLETLRKRDELLAMRDPKAIRKIQKSLKVFKSANKSVIEDAIDREHTAVTREGAEQPDQDDYGYESQEAAAIYQKMMEKYSKLPDEPKFPTSGSKSKKDLDGTRERVKQALLQEDEPVPHKRKRRTAHDDNVKEPSPPPKSEGEKKKEEKPKFRRPAAPPPMDFNQLLKLAEQKKCEPLEVEKKKEKVETEPERLMTKKQRMEYEEQMARRARRQERMDADRGGGKKVQKEERPVEREKKAEPAGFGRIPKLSDKTSGVVRHDSPKPSSSSNTSRTSPKPSSRSNTSRTDKDKVSNERDRKIQEMQKEIERMQREKKAEKEKYDKERADRERLEKLKAERERIERDIEKLNKDRDRLEKTKMKLESKEKIVDKSKLSNKEQELKKSIDLKSQNTYRIDKNSNDKKLAASKSTMNGHGSQGKPVPKDKILQAKQNGIRPENGKRPPEQSKIPMKSRPDERKPLPSSGKMGPPAAKPKVANSFDFDKHVNTLKNVQSSGVKKPQDVKRKMHPDDIKRKQMMTKRRMMDSDSEHDSEMDDFIDDGDTEEDYSKHIKEIFGYDKSRYRDMDDDDDPSMESSFSRQMHEEYVSKKIGIMEDLEDIKLEKKMKAKQKKRRISDD